MNRFKDLNKKVIQWANDKGILEKATPFAQIKKTEEEVAETKDAILAQDLGAEFYINKKNNKVNTQEEILDGFGDILVTVLIGCKMQNINPLDALEVAYNIISKRTGEMKNGVFVKSEDL